MRICLHDFSGHPFQVELARRLAARGHDVVHVSSAEYVSGKGDLTAEDGQRLSFVRIEVDRPYEKHSPRARVTWERAYAAATIEQLTGGDFDVFIACNIPLLANHRISRWARRHGLPWVFWHQDVYSAAMSDELRTRLPAPLAAVGARVLDRMESYIARRAGHVVAIGDAFTAVYDGWGVDPVNVSVVPNWAPLDRIFPVERDNRRSADLFPSDPDLRLVYAGTLGRKHNPDLLAQLVDQLATRDCDAHMVVVSEGDGADLVAASSAAAAGHLTVFGFQPAEDLPEVLSSADVLVALLEPDATRFSIPSKVLSYMAAGRPIVGLMPQDNPAASDIEQTGGLVVPPTTQGVAEAADWIASLAQDRGRIVEVGQRSRELAEARFDAEKVATTFDQILRRSARGS